MTDLSHLISDAAVYAGADSLKTLRHNGIPIYSPNDSPTGRGVIAQGIILAALPHIIAAIDAERKADSQMLGLLAYLAEEMRGNGRKTMAVAVEYAIAALSPLATQIGKRK